MDWWLKLGDFFQLKVILIDKIMNEIKKLSNCLEQPQATHSYKFAKLNNL